MSLSPYPGLRPFAREELDVFFGRDRVVAAMIDRMAATRFLAVTGVSGCGKSSLVRTGLMNALEIGLLATAGTRWRFLDFKPRKTPLANLAEALIETFQLPRQPHDAGLLAATLRGSPGALADLIAERRLEPDENVLVLVDQFEELFRHGPTPAEREEREVFVNLLLTAAAQRTLPIYVVITMRSDRIGGCARYPGLVEAVNDGQFLTPPMTRADCRLAIEGPAALAGGRVDPALTAQLLNDMGRVEDGLPLLQHALMRLWDREVAAGADAPTLTLARYDSLLGDLSRALHDHAEELLASLSPADRLVARGLFQAITDGGGGTIAERRPRTLAEIAAETGAPLDAIQRVVEAFRAPGHSFLTPGPPAALTPDTQIDISHEALIRAWSRLAGWVAEAETAAQRFRLLHDRAAAHGRGEADLLAGLDLANAVEWLRRERPSPAWSERHGGQLPLIESYIAASLAQQQEGEREEAVRLAAERAREEKSRRVRQLLPYGVAAMLVILVLIGVGIWQWQEAESQALAAEAARADAETQRALAEQEAAAAESARADAEAQRVLAEQEAAAAEDARRRADFNFQEAEKARLAAAGLLVQARSYLVALFGEQDRRVAALARAARLASDLPLARSLLLAGLAARDSARREMANLAIEESDLRADRSRLALGTAYEIRAVLLARPELHRVVPWLDYFSVYGFTPGGRFLLYATYSSLHLFDRETGIDSVVRSLEATYLEHATASADGRIVAVALGDGTLELYRDGTLAWSLDTIAMPEPVDETLSPQLVLSRDGNRLALLRGRPYLINVATGAMASLSLEDLGLEAAFEMATANAAAFSPDGTRLALAFAERADLDLGGVPTQQLIVYRLDAPGSGAPVDLTLGAFPRLSWSADGSQLLAFGSGGVRRFRFADPALSPEEPLFDPELFYHDVAVAADGAIVAASDYRFSFSDGRAPVEVPQTIWSADAASGTYFANVGDWMEVRQAPLRPAGDDQRVALTWPANGLRQAAAEGMAELAALQVVAGRWSVLAAQGASLLQQAQGMPARSLLLDAAVTRLSLSAQATAAVVETGAPAGGFHFLDLAAERLAAASVPAEASTVQLEACRRFESKAAAVSARSLLALDTTPPSFLASVADESSGDNRLLLYQRTAASGGGRPEGAGGYLQQQALAWRVCEVALAGDEAAAGAAPIVLAMQPSDAPGRALLHLARGQAESLELWDFARTAGPQRLAVLPLQAHLVAVAAAASSPFVVGIEQDGFALLWPSLELPPWRIEPNGAPVVEAALSPDGAHLALALDSGDVSLWSTASLPGGVEAALLSVTRLAEGAATGERGPPARLDGEARLVSLVGTEAVATLSFPRLPPALEEPQAGRDLLLAFGTVPLDRATLEDLRVVGQGETLASGGADGKQARARASICEVYSLPLFGEAVDPADPLATEPEARGPIFNADPTVLRDAVRRCEQALEAAELDGLTLLDLARLRAYDADGVGGLLARVLPALASYGLGEPGGLVLLAQLAESGFGGLGSDDGTLAIDLYNMGFVAGLMIPEDAATLDIGAVLTDELLRAYAEEQAAAGDQAALAALAYAVGIQPAPSQAETEEALRRLFMAEVLGGVPTGLAEGLRGVRASLVRRLSAERVLALYREAQAAAAALPPAGEETAPLVHAAIARAALEGTDGLGDLVVELAGAIQERPEHLDLLLRLVDALQRSESGAVAAELGEAASRILALAEGAGIELAGGRLLELARQGDALLADCAAGHADAAALLAWFGALPSAANLDATASSGPSARAVAQALRLGRACLALMPAAERLQAIRALDAVVFGPAGAPPDLRLGGEPAMAAAVARGFLAAGEPEKAQRWLGAVLSDLEAHYADALAPADDRLGWGLAVIDILPLLSDLGAAQPDRYGGEHQGAGLVSLYEVVDLLDSDGRQADALALILAAVPAAQAVIEAWPSALAPALRLAYLTYRAGRLAEALGDIETAFDAHATTLAVVESALTHLPESPELLHEGFAASSWLASLSSRLGDFAGAVGYRLREYDFAVRRHRVTSFPEDLVSVGDALGNIAWDRTALPRREALAGLLVTLDGMAAFVAGLAPDDAALQEKVAGALRAQPFVLVLAYRDDPARPALLPGPPAEDCDVLASFAGDPLRVAPPVGYDAIDHAPAIAACRAALERHPAEPRFQFQLARAIIALADTSGETGDPLYLEGAQLLEAAARLGYPAAFSMLTSGGDRQSFAELLDFGDLTAFMEGYRGRVLRLAGAAVAADLLRDPQGYAPVDPAQIAWLLQRAAALGDPDAHLMLSDLLAAGTLGPTDPETAMMHRLLAERLPRDPDWDLDPPAAAAMTLQQLRASVTPEQLVAARTRAAAFRPEPLFLYP